MLTITLDTVCMLNGLNDITNIHLPQYFDIAKTCDWPKSFRNYDHFDV